jgi:hypothetical protein
VPYITLNCIVAVKFLGIEGYVDFLWLWSATRAYWFFGKVMETDESDERKSIHWKHIYILMYSIEYYAGH